MIEVVPLPEFVGQIGLSGSADATPSKWVKKQRESCAWGEEWQMFVPTVIVRKMNGKTRGLFRGW